MFAGGEGLQGTSTATTIRVRDGAAADRRAVRRAQEQIGGYYVLDCKDLDDALNWASQIPEAQSGAIEVRPIMDYEAMEAGDSAGSAAAS